MTALPNIPARAPRAVRNSNPGNIRVGDPWQGLMELSAMTDEQKDEKAFCVFASPKWGFRALARVLISYQDKHGIHTIAGVIARWAPPSENDTAAYVAHVCALTEQAADSPLDLHSFADLRPLCKAIAIHESGAWLFEDADLDAGLTLAGAPAPPAALASSRTVKAGLAGGGISVISAVEAVQQIKPAVDTLSQIKEYWPLAASIVFAVFFAYIVYWRVDDWMRAKR